MHAAVAGAIAATLWGLQEPFDRRLFRCDYSDVRLVGGLPVHAFNAVRRRTHAGPRQLALTLALAEHAALWPLVGLLDRDLVRNPRAFAQGTYRHALFGLV